MADDIRIFQIYYNDATRAAVDPAFEPLDNSANERPDWFEYWPIRRYLDDHPLQEGVYYGFLSPKFAAKTRLPGAQVKAFVADAGGADVVTFSPFPDLAAFYINVFEQGEHAHQGLTEVAQAFLAAIGLDVDIYALVMDWRSAVFSNYFVAKASFWREWKNIFDQCFALAEDPASPLHAALNTPTRHDKPAQMKIFLMERIASILLATRSDWSVKNYPSAAMPLSHPRWSMVFPQIVALDAMKLAYLRTGEPTYLKCFRSMQAWTSAALQQAARPLREGAR